MVTAILIGLLLLVLFGGGSSSPRPESRSRRREMLDNANNPRHHTDPLANAVRDSWYKPE